MTYVSYISEFVEILAPHYYHPFVPKKLVFVGVKKANKITVMLVTTNKNYPFSGHLILDPYVVAFRKQMIDSQL